MHTLNCSKSLIIGLLITSSTPISFAQAPGTKHWMFATHGEIHSSPAVAPDGTIYVCSWDARLYAVNSNGTEKWEFLANNRINSSPAIGPDGTIYVGSDDNNLYAVLPDGKQRWLFPTGNLVFTDPAIAADGTVYIGSDDGNLYAVNANGSEKWRFRTGGRIPAPAVGADGTIYTATASSSTDTTSTIYALNPDGSVRWKYKSSAFSYGDGPNPSCIIDADGTIVCNPTLTGGYFERINTNGTFKQSCENIFGATPLVIGPGGILYGRKIYSDGFDAVFATFNLRWTFPTSSSKPAFGAAAVAADGTVYFGRVGGTVYALDMDGNEKWETETGGKYLTNPTIGPDGTIYIGSDDKNLYAIKGTSPLATGPWPMYRRDAQHTGRVPSPNPSQSTLSLNMYPGLLINGVVGNSYRIDYVNDLTQTNNWQALATVTMDRTPYFFVDVNAANTTKRFYRAELIP